AGQLPQAARRSGRRRRTAGLASGAEGRGAAGGQANDAARRQAGQALSAWSGQALVRRRPAFAAEAAPTVWRASLPVGAASAANDIPQPPTTPDSLSQPRLSRAARPARSSQRGPASAARRRAARAVVFR